MDPLGQSFKDQMTLQRVAGPDNRSGSMIRHFMWPKLYGSCGPYRPGGFGAKCRTV